MPGLVTQIELLHSLGIRLNAGVTLADLDRWGPGAYESASFSCALLYQTLGQTLERPPHTALTNQLWHFDTEAIYAPGDYVRILENLQRVSGGEIEFSAMVDEIDFAAGRAVVRFSLGARSHSLHLEQHDDWVDPLFLGSVADLVAEHSSRRFTYYSSGGQDCVIGWATPAERDRLRAATGLDVVWLE